VNIPTSGHNRGSYTLACMCKNSCDPLAQADFIFPQQCALSLRPSKVWMKQSIMVPRLFTLTKTYVPYRWLCYHRLIFFLATQHHFQNIQGLVVGAPYLACAIIGCWLTEPLNRLFARRGTIFTSCVIAAVASVWEGVANTWVNQHCPLFSWSGNRVEIEYCASICRG
jgi:hypothetical protein